MSLLVDTSVWSLALRRDAVQESPLVERLRGALLGRESVFTTGIILQELLQGFHGPADRSNIIERFSFLPMIVPERSDYIQAAEIRNKCRRSGVQVGTIDALLIAICLRRELQILSADKDFRFAAQHVPLDVWSG